MGFIKYLGKELKKSVVKWRYSDGRSILVDIILAFGQVGIIVTFFCSPKPVQQIIIIISAVLICIILLAVAVPYIWQIIDWFSNKYKEYKREL